MAAIELRDLRYLAASAVAGNFVRAAESLGLNASTISRRIAWLEDELGGTLFERGLAAVLISLFGWILALRGLNASAYRSRCRRTRSRSPGAFSASSSRSDFTSPM
jgi:hypothetical protein